MGRHAAGWTIGVGGEQCSDFDYPTAHDETNTAIPVGAGDAWVTAACGNPTMIQGTGPNTLLARSTDLGICMGTPGAPSVLVGVYEHGSGLDDDLVAMSNAYHHAVRIDDGGVGWIFVTQGDAPTLAGLARYGFRIE